MAREPGYSIGAFLKNVDLENRANQELTAPPRTIGRIGVAEDPQVKILNLLHSNQSPMPWPQIASQIDLEPSVVMRGIADLVDSRVAVLSTDGKVTLTTMGEAFAMGLPERK